MNRKKSTFFVFATLVPFLGIAPRVLADTTAAKSNPRALDSHVDQAVSKAELPNFTVQYSLIREIEVVESPEFPDLPPVKGKINVTVQLVDDPLLQDPPPLPALPLDDPAVQARLAETKETHEDTELIFISATVYGHSYTLLRWYPDGPQSQEMAAWSNLDFNHFSGFATYEVPEINGTVKSYGLLMGIGNEEAPSANSDSSGDRPPLSELDVQAISKLPSLAQAGPAFILTEAISSVTPDTRIPQALHDLYRAEGAKMADAFEGRSKAEASRKAYLIANPPAPADVTIRFWNREKALAQSNKEDGQ